MDVLKKIFPMSFKFTGETGQFVLGIIIHAAIWLLSGGIGAVLSLVTFGLSGIIGGIASLYGLAGLVICILVQTKVIKE